MSPNPSGKPRGTAAARTARATPKRPSVTKPPRSDALRQPPRTGTMRHKGYTAKVLYDDANGILRGEVIDLQDEIGFAAASVAQLRREFHAAVDGYLLDCATRGVEPAKPFSGKILLRLPPELHRRAAITAASLDVSLNDFLVGSIEVGVARIAAARPDEVS